MSHCIVVDKGSFQIAIAHGQLLCNAQDLVRERYIWRGYKGEGEKPLKHLLPDITFCAIKPKSSDVIATVSVRMRSNEKPLLCESSYAKEVEKYLKRGFGNVAEIIQFATKKNDVAVVGALLHTVVIFAHQSNVENLFAEINPRHTRIYKDGFGFDVAGNLRECRRVQAPAILMHTETKALQRQLAMRNTEGGNALMSHRLTNEEAAEVGFFFEQLGAQVPV